MFDVIGLTGGTLRCDAITHAAQEFPSSILATRYMGLAKTRLQHLITAVALNVVRLGAWWLGTP
jgi:hypothetical protein